MAARDTDFTPERIAEVRRMNDDLIAEFARAWLKAHDREQRLAGARELYDRLDENTDLDAALEAMERET